MSESLKRFLPDILCLLLLFVLGNLIFQDYLWGDATYLFKDIGSDTINTFYPHFVQTQRLWNAEGMPEWSFHQGMGHNAFGFSFGDPFTIAMLLVSPESLPKAIAWAEFFKLFFAGLVFYAFLLERKTDKPVAIFGALLYAFSGFMVLGSNWYIFSTEGFNLALLLLGTERLVRRGGMAFLALGLGLTASNSPFNLFPFFLIILPYVLLRMSQEHGKDGKAWLQLLLRGSLAVLLGLGFTSMFSAEALSMMLDSPRVATEASLVDGLSTKPMFELIDAQQRMSVFARFFGNDMLGQGSNYTGWENYLEGPTLYCGLATLLLAPQALALSRRKDALLLGAWAFVVLLPLAFPYFRYAFWAFQGNYYRAYNFMVAIMLLVLAARALQYLWEGGKANLFVLAGTLFLLLYMLNNPAKTKEVENILVVREIKSLSMLLLLLQAALLLGLSLAKGQLRKILFFVLLGISFLELFYFGVKTLANRPVITKTELAQKVGYNDYSVDAADKLRELDQASLFYRVSKNYNSGPSVHSSMNDGKVQNYFGSASYHSFNQKEYILFLKAMGIVDASNENATRWAVGVEPRPLLQTLTSHKYRFLRNAEAQAAGYGYSFAFELGDVKVYKNENFIPLGFVYRSAIDTARLSSLDPIQRDIALLRAVALDDASKSSLPKLDSIPAIDQYSLDMLAADAAALRRDTVQWSSFSNKNLEGKLSLQEPGYLFFSIPYSKGWHIEINGEERSLEKVNIGFLGLPLDAGNYEIKLSYRLPYAHKLFWPSVLCFLGLIALFYYDYRRIREQQLLV